MMFANASHPRARAKCGRPSAAIRGKRYLAPLLAFSFLLGAAHSLCAQLPPSSLLIAAATRPTEGDGQAWVYVAWSPTDAAVLRGRVFTVHARAGGLTDAGMFQPQGIVAPVAPQPDALAPLVARGAALGDDPAALSAALGALVNKPEVQAATTPEARLAITLLLAATDAGAASAIEMLAGRFHAVNFALGRAWAGRFPQGARTIEIREFDPALRQDRFVVARVAVESGRPVPLPAPDAPTIATPRSSADDLRVALLWGEPEALRRRSPLLAGFDLWRMPAYAARTAGWDVQSPTIEALSAKAERVNDLPIQPRQHLSAAEVAIRATDAANAFVTDAGPLLPEWKDGDEYAWFVVARDALDQPGQPSRAGFGFVCALFPPEVPRGLSAVNTYIEAAGLVRPQRITLTWSAAETNSGTVTRYEIYRGENELPPVNSTNELPATAQVAVIAFDAAAARYEWADTSLQPEVNTNLYGHGFWYAVRSVRETRCGPVASAPCPPVFINLRRLDAPPAPVGDLGINCPRVVVLPPDANSGVVLVRRETPDPGNRHYRLALQRRDMGIAWVEVTVNKGLEGEPPLSSPRLRFAEGESTIEFDFEVTRVNPAPPIPIIRVVAGSFTGAKSNPRLFEIPGDPGVDSTLRAVVSMATISMTDYRPDDPFYADVAEGPFFLPDTARGVDAMLRARSPTASEEVLIQAAAPGTPPEGDWRFVTITRPIIFVRSEGAWFVFADAMLPAGVDVPHTVSYRAWILRPIDQQDAVPCAHVARPADSDAVLPVKIRLYLPPRARQWRVFRQVDDSPLTLIAEGLGEPIPGKPQSVVEATDDAMPPGAARLCYFGQVADENGNWSPLGPLGCEDVLPASPPVPLLAKPEPEGDSGSPVMRLRWFCPPEGVRTFGIILHAVSGSKPAQGKTDVTSKLKAEWVTSPQLVSWYSKSALDALVSSLTGPDMLATGPVGDEPAGTALGPGPDFTFAVDVVADRTYEVQVVAIDARGNPGPASGIQRFTWKVPRPIADRNVPWPQRPLPPVHALSTNLQATVLSSSIILWPVPTNVCGVGVRIGRMPIGQRELFNDLLGFANGEHGGRTLRLFVTRQAIGAGRDLDSFLFHDEISKPPRPEFRAKDVVLYRQQIPSLEFPESKGAVVQVSSLFKHIAAWQLPDAEGFEWLDPNLALTLQFGADPAAGGNLSPTLDIHLMDLHPVVKGARYRYWLVHFSSVGEPDQTIPAGEVEVPL